MNILFVASRLHPNYCDSLESLASRHNVTVLVSGKFGNERKTSLNTIVYDDIWLSLISQRYYLWKGLSLEQFIYRKKFPSLFFVLCILKKYNIDVVYIRPENLNLLAVVKIAAFVKGIKVVFYSQKFLSKDGCSRKTVYPLLDTSAISMHQCENYIPLMINLDRFLYGGTGGRIYKKGDTLEIVSVGKFVERKGHMVLIDAIHLLKDKVKIKCSIYGNYSNLETGVFFERLKEKVRLYHLEDSVVFMPECTPEEMSREYRKYHLFVYAGWVSRDVGSTDANAMLRCNGKSGTLLYSLLEAMSAGLPIVCSSEKKVIGAIDSNRNGLVFDKGSAVDLAAKIEAITKLDLKSMGKASRMIVERYYNSQSFTSFFEKFISRQ